MSEAAAHENTPPESVQWHEFANVFPMLQGEALHALRDDIEANGVREPVVFLGTAILDGRNRYICARDLGVEYPRREFGSQASDGEDPLAFVISHNLTRRHLSESQRASAAAKIANMQRGANQHTSIEGTSTAVAAKMLSVGRASVERARKVHDMGAPELVQAVDEGRASVFAAADVAELPREEQVGIVARGEREILEAAKTIRATKAKKRRIERLANLEKIAKGNAELGTDTKYPVIYADPPWRYENPSMAGSSRSIENHYPTMALDEICALPVADLATEDAMLYLWTTAPKLAESFEVVTAWGFEYRTCMVWDKVKIGMGYYARNQHEHLLICRRGNIPAPEPGTQPSSVYREVRGEHSAKPHFFYEMIEADYPNLPKIELFCRSPRKGWSVWGNQSEVAA